MFSFKGKLHISDSKNLGRIHCNLYVRHTIDSPKIFLKSQILGCLFLSVTLCGTEKTPPRFFSLGPSKRNDGP